MPAKNRPLVALVAFATILGLGFERCAWAHDAGSSEPYPTVTLEYSEVFDNACAQRTGVTLDAALVATIREHVPGYREQWIAQGPALLRTTVEITGQPFSFKETRAAVITCGFPSTSLPLMVNARAFHHFSQGELAQEQRALVGTLFHELLHRYLTDVLSQRGSETTPLLTKYAGEPPFLRNHLHLFAVEQAVYAQLGMGEHADVQKALEAQLTNAALFARARQIVADEGVDAFLAELRP